MSKKKPDHNDAELILKLYDLRRETVMRQSRATIAQWLPKTFEEVVAVMQPTHPSNAAFRQVSSYYEMAYGFARHGVVNADLLAESTTEGLFLFAKIEPHLGRMRKEVSPTAFSNVEWLVKKSAEAKKRFALVKTRIATMMAAAK